MYWVVDSSTTADTDQILQASQALRLTTDSVDAVSVHLLRAASYFETALAELPQTSAAAATHYALARINIRLWRFMEALTQHIVWQERAAILLAEAEGNVAGLFAACTVAEFGCEQRWGLLADSRFPVPGFAQAAQLGALGDAALRSFPLLSSENSGQGAEGIFLQRQLNRFTSVPAFSLTNPWQIFAGQERSLVKQMARAGGTLLSLPQRLFGWKDKLLVATAPAGGGLVGGAGHAGQYVVVGRGGSSDLQPLSIPQQAGGVSGGKVGQGDYGRSPIEVAAPVEIGGVLELMEEPAPGAMVEILRHSDGGGGGPHRSWSVLIRGTQEWLPGNNPQDMLSNLQEIGGAASDQRRAVIGAMELAGIRPGEPVELVGHSQGGIVAANLAADPEFVSRFGVVSVLTAGSPVALAAPAKPQVQSLHLENTSDPVPALDGEPNPAHAGRLTVHFSPDHAPSGSSAHGLATYREAANGLEKGKAESAEVASWLEERRQALGLGADTNTISIQYWTKRIS